MEALLSDQALAIHCYCLQYPMITLADSESPD